MKYTKVWQLFLIATGFIVLACSIIAPETPEPSGRPVTVGPLVTLVPNNSEPTTVQAEANRDGVAVIRGETAEREGLLAPNRITLSVGDSVDVDSQGRAILRFADLLTVEVLRDGGLTLQQLALEEQSAIVNVLQIGGAVIHDFNPEAEIERRFTVQTEFATITATGTRFLVVREDNSPLEWVIGLDAGPNDLMVTANGVSKAVESNQARWMAINNEPSAGIEAKMNEVNTWLVGLQNGTAERTIGEVVWNAADMVVNTQNLSPAFPQVGVPFILQPDNPQAIQFILQANTSFGVPSYTAQDCNQDGILDLVIEQGILRLDFRPVIGRVSNIDITLINLDQTDSGTLTVFDPAYQNLGQTTIGQGPEVGHVLRLMGNVPYHYAELSMTNGCFLGVSLTPPEMDPRPAVDKWSLDIGSTAPPTDVTPTPTPTPPNTYVTIESPADGASDITNGFILRGLSTVPFEREILLIVEALSGDPITYQPIFVQGEDFGGDGFFEETITLDYNLPADVRLRVQHISAKDGSVIVEDTVTLTPLLPATEAPPAERPPNQGLAIAPLVNAGQNTLPLVVDGEPEDWLRVQEASGLPRLPITAIVSEFQNSTTCANLYQLPGAPAQPNTIDLAGQVAFAYDAGYLYVAFWVDDDGFVGYSGDDYRYFQGDAPQLLLDIDLPGDYPDTTVNGDDWQIDFHPGLRGVGLVPSGALWALPTLTARPLNEAQIASSSTQTGYFLEAALPWASFNIRPQVDLLLGMVASISDNDTFNTNTQECMISSSPARNWEDPTTWGTLILGE